MKKGFKIGCLVIGVPLLALFLYLVFTRKGRITENVVMKDSIRYYTDEIKKRMIRVGQSLPKLDASANPKPFPAGTINWKETLQTSVEEVKRFTDSGYVSVPALRYGPWLTEVLNSVEKTYVKGENWSIYEVIKTSREVFQKKYLMVYQPIYHFQPKVVDKKSFQPGIFYGWMIFVDFKTGEPLGYAQFESHTTLFEIENKKYGVGVEVVNVPIFTIPLINTTDVEKKLQDNFREEFFRKSDSTFLAMKKQK